MAKPDIPAEVRRALHAALDELLERLQVCDGCGRAFVTAPRTAAGGGVTCERAGTAQSCSAFEARVAAGFKPVKEHGNRRLVRANDQDGSMLTNPDKQADTGDGAESGESVPCSACDGTGELYQRDRYGDPLHCRRCQSTGKVRERRRQGESPNPGSHTGAVPKSSTD